MTPIKFFIAGVQFRTPEERKAILDHEPGDHLSLIPEPENQYDPNAVKIMSGANHFGYVPRRFSSEVSAALEVGINIKCTVTTINPEAKLWERIEVTIGIEETEEEAIDRSLKEAFDE